MAKPQMPIDGKLGKNYKVTSAYGWRIHPVEKTKKHHNGVDIWGSAESIYIESAYDGKVVFAGPSKSKNPDGSVGGFGYHVQVLSRENGMWIVNNYCHMKLGSIKVKVGQQIEAGTVLGIMGATGMVTGKHLHWETCIGRTYKWSGDGKGYLDPIKFLKAVIARHEAVEEALVATPDVGSVQPPPNHG
jgi:murein DD-endopeptidase MepM/ murein hydrolase activator NlpD